MGCGALVRASIQIIALLCIERWCQGATAFPFASGILEQTSPIRRDNGQKHEKPNRNEPSMLSQWTSQITLDHSEAVQDAFGFPLSQLSSPRPVVPKYYHDNVLRFKLNSRDDAATLIAAATYLDLDIWSVSQDWLDLRVDQTEAKSFLGLLPRHLHTSYHILMSGSELSEAVEASHAHLPRTAGSIVSHGTDASTKTTLAIPTDEFFEDYRPLSVITPWMQLLQSLYPTHLQLLNIGHSFENREIPAFRIGASPMNLALHDAPRKTILITGGAHAREWISVSTANFIAHALISNYGKDDDITSLLESVDVVVIPTINPDGYSYTWEVDRLWRKNRQTTPLPFCRGIDLDRSFGFMWKHFDGRASDNPCSENYAGDQPFDAVEARQIGDWVRNEIDENNTTFVGFLDLHSYSQQILVPYAFSCYEDPPNLEDLEETGEGLAKAIRQVHLQSYAVNRACETNTIGTINSIRKGPQRTLEGGGGGSLLDWLYHIGVKNAFQVKLRDTGSYGFFLPKEYILPSGEEIFNAILYLGNALK